MKTVTGDLITLAEQGEFDVIVHGCNCFCTMGSGIALQIKKRYPIAYAADCETIKGDKSKLGTYTKAESFFTIVNLYTQYDYNPKNNPCDYKAMRDGFKLINKDFAGKRIGYPLIGAGLAGGDWNKISKIIDEELVDCDHTLVMWDQ